MNPMSTVSLVATELLESKSAGQKGSKFHADSLYIGPGIHGKGMLPEAIAEMEIFVSKADYGKAYLGDLACLYAKAGRSAEAYKLLDQMKELGNVQYYPAIEQASAYAGLSEKEEAFEWLEEAIRRREPGLVSIRGKPFLTHFIPIPSTKIFSAKSDFKNNFRSAASQYALIGKYNIVRFVRLINLGFWVHCNLVLRVHPVIRRNIQVITF